MCLTYHVSDYVLADQNGNHFSFKYFSSVKYTKINVGEIMILQMNFFSQDVTFYKKFQNLDICKYNYMWWLAIYHKLKLK